MRQDVKRLLIGLHHTELGGSQLNALDLATTMRERGYHVHVVATHASTPGPVADLVRERALPLTLIKHGWERVHRTALYRRCVARELISLVHHQRIDLVHAYESSLILDAFYGPHLHLGTGLVGTVYGMAVSTWLPRHIALIAGTAKIAEEARAVGQAVALIEPPVNVAADNPALVDGTAFRAQFPGETLYVLVSRLEPDMKQEGIERAIDAMRSLNGRLIIVGDGPSRAELLARAARVNAELNRQAVVIYGPLQDPRPAYAAADVVLGMGGSALRGMAFAKPVVVLGIEGFSLECTPQTAVHFFSCGFYGVGDGTSASLVNQIRHVLARQRELGKWGRETVIARYSLDAAANMLERVYQNTPIVTRATALSAAARTGMHKLAADVLPPSVRARVRPLVRRLLH